MDVWEYFESKKREVEEFGLTLDDDFLFAEERGSDGQRGRVWGRISISERAFLSVSERVEVVGSGIHRTEYAYFLIIDGTEIWGYERDPTHTPSNHRHDRHHESHACDPVTFKESLAKVWESASDEYSWEPPPPQPSVLRP